MKTDGLAIPKIFEHLGVHAVVNGRGIYSDLGGSRLSPSVWAAMGDMNQYFVSMADLLDASGKIIARYLGTEAARVTPGAAASIMLMVAGVMTGNDASRTELLPRTDGLRDEIVLQRNHRYRYDRQITMTGARLVLAGDEQGTTSEQVRRVLTPRTAAIFVPAHRDGLGNTVLLSQVAAIGREHGVPTVVDAAYLSWPIENLTRYPREGADLVCFSAKYFGGPKCGRLRRWPPGSRRVGRAQRFHAVRVWSLPQVRATAQARPPNGRGDRPGPRGVAGDGSRGALGLVRPHGRGDAAAVIGNPGDPA